VRLLGDRHAQRASENSERRFIENMAPSLDIYLCKKASEVFIIESGEFKRKTLFRITIGVLHRELPLMHRLLCIADKVKISFQDYTFCEQPKIPLICFDVRARLKTPLNLSVLLNRVTISDDACAGLPKHAEIMDILVDLLKQCYDTHFFEAMLCKFKKLRDNFEQLEQLLQDKDPNKKFLNVCTYRRNMIEKILLDFADYGFLSTIGKACYQKQNVSLYTGSDHSKVLLQDLKNMGYEVLFLKENDVNTPLSKEDCEAFFTIKPMPKSKL
jgi:hypothetical protein